MRQHGEPRKFTGGAGAWRWAAAAGVCMRWPRPACCGGAGTASAASRGPVLAFTPAPDDYGHVTPGQTASQKFTLANTGMMATGKLRVRLAGAAAFKITGTTCKNLAPGKKCTVTVRFKLAMSTAVTATLIAVGQKRAATAADALAGTGQELGQSSVSCSGRPGPRARSGRPTWRHQHPAPRPTAGRAAGSGGQRHQRLLGLSGAGHH